MPRLPVLALSLAVIAVIAGQTGPRSARRLVAEERAGYVADERDGRIVAEVRVAVWAVGRGADARYELVVEPSAVGADVDPIPGFRGVRGANLQTAHDLGRIVAAGELSVVTLPIDAHTDGPRTDEARGGARVGTVGALQHGHLPERRLAGERIDHAARTKAPQPVAVTLSSGALPSGAWRTEVRVDGRARLAVDFDAADGTARITGVRALEEHPIQETTP